MDELRKQHDEYIANKPEGMSDDEFAQIIDEHKSSDCPFCNENAHIEQPTEGGDMETFTKDELDAAVAAAVAPVQTELESLKEAAAESEVDSRVAEAKAEAAAAIEDLQGKLDAAVLEAENAKKELEDVHAFLATEAERAELAELAVAIREDRKARIQEVANFPADYLEGNLDRWCAKDEAEFDAWLEDLKLTSAPKEEAEVVESDEEDTSDVDTAMKFTRPVVTESSKSTGDLQNLFGASRAGIDIRKV